MLLTVLHSVCLEGEGLIAARRISPMLRPGALSKNKIKFYNFFFCFFAIPPRAAQGALAGRYLGNPVLHYYIAITLLNPYYTIT